MRPVEPRYMQWLPWPTSDGEKDACEICAKLIMPLCAAVDCDHCHIVVHLSCMIRHIAACWRRMN